VKTEPAPGMGGRAPEALDRQSGESPFSEKRIDGGEGAAIANVQDAMMKETAQGNKFQRIGGRRIVLNQ